jgi:8-oxo-dGTP diphosphatase
VAGLTIELVAHMDAGDRRLWTRPQDERPLSDLGRRQAELMAEALSRQPLDALYSSPALRCVQTLEPLAARFGLRVEVEDGLHETDAWLPPPSWRDTGLLNDPLGGAYAAGLAWQAIRNVRGRHATGRVVACTHGDVLPSLVMFVAGAYGLELPTPHPTRGGWYTLNLEGDAVSIEHHPVLPNFPLE